MHAISEEDRHFPTVEYRTTFGFFFLYLESIL